MFAAFQAAVAAQMGVDPSQVQLQGVHTDGDDVVGCGGQVSSGFSLNVDDNYVASLGDSSALADCMLTAQEMAADPEAAAMGEAIIAAQAAALGVDPSTISITAVHTDGDPTPGCQTSGRRALKIEGSHSY
jgi:hypothetical protein